MEKILDIIEAIALEKDIDKALAMEAFKEALDRTAKRLTSQSSSFEITIDEATKSYEMKKVIEVVANNDERLIYIDRDEQEQPSDSFMSLDEAKEYDSDLEVGDKLVEPFVLEDYGRTASANLFRELEYHIQRKVEIDLYTKYREMVGKVLYGNVSRVDDQDNTHVEFKELKGILTQRNRIKGEVFKHGDTVRALLRFVKTDPHHGLILELSRTSPKFLDALLANEVPEIEDGAVEIMSSARIPGERAKVALRANSASIDPIGATVGVKGVRINAVSQELNGENIDCVEYSDIPEIYISRALSPALTQSVEVDREEKIAKVNIASDQKAKAIGKSGVNIRLASMLTGYQIELNEVEGSRAIDSFEDETPKRSSDTSALEDLFK